MSAPEKKPERPNLPEVAIDPTEGPRRVKKDWDAKHAGKGIQYVNVPRSENSVAISRIDVADNVVSVWVTEDTSLPPEYVIVNPPTALYVDKNTSIEDPLGAIAHIINGAKK